MNTTIALLRGINVGGSGVLPMKELTALLEEMGFEAVRTYIQSGNVVFRSEALDPRRTADAIRDRILETHGFAPPVLLLDAGELRQAAANNPFQTADGKQLHLFFLESSPANPDLAGLEAIRAETERFELHGRVFYLYAPDGIGRSRLAAAVERRLGVPATARNWNTIGKLLEMAAG